MPNAREDVLELLAQVPGVGNESERPRATEAALNQFTERTGITLPPELKCWLSVVNGARVGPGGVLGIRPDDPYCDVESILRGYPEWKQKGWIPIAGDGCGNYYVLVTDDDLRPVYFVDTTSDYLTPAYIAASELWAFLWFLFRDELGESGWPFSPEYVLRHDPRIADSIGAPLPWNA